MKQNRWYIYQKERFPLAMYIPMILAFSFSAISYSAATLNGQITIKALAVSFYVSISFFMLLRIADEYKDFEEDSKYRPYRPVPRGLVKREELGRIGFGLGIGQLIICGIYEPRLLILLVILWIYYGCMCKEFFISKWLRSHIGWYMFSHMLIMPQLDFFATACEFWPRPGVQIGSGLVWFIISSFFDGIVIEVGRKMRAEEDEEEGVETYSKLWGQKKSIGIWLGAMIMSLASTFFAVYQLGGAALASITLGGAFIACFIGAINYLKKPHGKNGSRLEVLSGAWTLVDYLSLGIIPLLL